MADALVWIHLAATLFMTGLIWYVQIVHYPLFGKVGPASFREYQEANMRRASWVVGPPMLAEAATAGALLLWRPAAVPLSLAVAGFALLGVVWLSTAVLQIPHHRALLEAFEPRAHTRLVAGNRIRTAAWSLRAGLALAMAMSL